MNREAMEDPALKSMIAKIAIVPSLPPDEYQTAEVDVVMRDGHVLSRTLRRAQRRIYRAP